jgi:hypothetical protein
VFVKWQWSGIEHMGKFQRLYGLPPIGPHHGFISGLPIWEFCQTCGGRGLFDVENGKSYECCGVCDGIRAHLTCSLEELKAVQHIARAMIRHGKASSVLPGENPVEQFFAMIADASLRAAARRFLEQGRIFDLHRVLVWQGIVTEADELAQRAYDEREDEEDEEEIEEEETHEAKGPPHSRSLADLTAPLDDWKERGMIND